MDFATGDVITPHSTVYGFKSLFSDKTIEIQAYPLETILAEKLHTIYLRDFANSRSKDFYDVYLIAKLRKEQIDCKRLDQACRNTFAARNTHLDYDELISLLNFLKTNRTHISRWLNFCEINQLDNNHSFEKVIFECIYLVDELRKVSE